MAKILKNNTASPIFISDAAITIDPSPGLFKIHQEDYLSWAYSKITMGLILSGSIIMNDGIADLSPADGIVLLQSIAGAQAPNMISIGNSTTNTLNPNNIFTGTGEDVTQYGNITISVFANVAGSFTVQWSNDNVNWRADGDVYNVSANILKKTSYGPAAKYFRIVYTNGGNNQTTFFIQTTYRVGHTKPSTHKINETINDDSDSELTKAVMTGRKADATYGTAKLSNNNSVSVSDISENGGVNGTLTVGTTAVEVKVGGSALTNRKQVSLYNSSTRVMYWGHSNAVTTSNGIAIFKDQERGWSVGTGTSIWVICDTPAQTVRVAESA